MTAARVVDGCLAKLRRASELIASLDAEMTAFLADSAPEIRGEANADASEFTFYAVVKAEPPLHWGVMIGEIVHDVRSCLDHIIWALAEPPVWSNQFPIFSTPKPAREASMLQNVPAVSATIIHNLQPYNQPAGQPRALDPLAQLALLSNTDKHRVLPVAVAALQFIEYGFSANQTEDRVHFGVPVADGMELAWFAFGKPGIKASFKAAFGVVFEDPTLPPGQVAAVMRRARDHVAHRVLPQLAATLGYGLGRVWKIGHPISVCHNDSSGVSEGPTR